MAIKEVNLGILQPLPSGYDPGTSIFTATDRLTDILSNTLGVLTIFASLYFILQFVLGGLSWITSSGERERVDKAQKKMTHAAIGLIVVVAAYAIAFIIGQILGIDILNPAKYIISVLKPGGPTPTPTPEPPIWPH